MVHERMSHENQNRHFDSDSSGGEFATPPAFSLLASCARRNPGQQDAINEANENHVPGVVPFEGFGGNIILTPNKTTTLLGRLEGGTSDIAFNNAFRVGQNEGGLNLLMINDWSFDKNMSWLNEAMNRRDPLRLVSDPEDLHNLERENKHGQTVPTVFAQELMSVYESDYQYEPSRATFEA